MAFIKKIIILNEVTKGYGKAELRGLATVEKNGDRAVCRLTVFNLTDVRTGGFVFGVKCRNLRLQKFELTQTSQNFQLNGDTDIDGAISCILAYKYTDRAVPLMWGSTDGKRIFEGNMTDGFIDGPAPVMPVVSSPPAKPAADTYKPEEKREQPESEAEKQEEPEKKEETAAVDVIDAAADADAADNTDTAAAAPEYQDYAVAAENFYPADYGEGQGDIVPDHSPPAADTKNGKFYAAIKSQLDELFENYPKEEYLCAKLTGTDWVKVDYDNDGRYYTVGIITEEDAVKYICYGVPGKYAKMPPPELKGFCQWLPFDVEKPDGEGYWMMYQDAENGKSVTLEII